jgi:hypothetical protein
MVRCRLQAIGEPLISGPIRSDICDVLMRRLFHGNGLSQVSKTLSSHISVLGTTSVLFTCALSASKPTQDGNCNIINRLGLKYELVQLGFDRQGARRKQYSNLRCLRARLVTG